MKAGASPELPRASNTIHPMDVMSNRKYPIPTSRREEATKLQSNDICRVRQPELQMMASPNLKNVSLMFDSTPIPTLTSVLVSVQIHSNTHIPTRLTKCRVKGRRRALRSRVCPRGHTRLFAPAADSLAIHRREPT